MASPSNGVSGLAGDSSSSTSASADVDYCSTALLMQRHHHEHQHAEHQASAIPDVLASCTTSATEQPATCFDSSSVSTITEHGPDDQQGADDRRDCSFVLAGCSKSKLQPSRSEQGIQSTLHRLQLSLHPHHQQSTEQLNPYLAAVQQAFSTGINNNVVGIGDTTINGLCQSSLGGLNDRPVVVEDEPKLPGSVASMLGSSSADAASCAANVTPSTAGLYHPGSFEWHLPYAAAASQFYNTAASVGGRTGCFSKFEDCPTSTYYRSSPQALRTNPITTAVSKLTQDNCCKNSNGAEEDRMSVVDDEQTTSPTATTMSSSSSSTTSPSFLFDGGPAPVSSGYSYQQLSRNHPHQQLYSGFGGQNQQYQGDLGSSLGTAGNSCAFSSSASWIPWHQISHVQPALSSESSKLANAAGEDKIGEVGSTTSLSTESQNLESNTAVSERGTTGMENDNRSASSSTSRTGDEENKPDSKPSMSSAELGILDIPALPPADELKFYPKRFTNQARNKRKAGSAANSGNADDKASSDSKSADKTGVSSPSTSNVSSNNNPHQRPAYSYVMMIAMAIRSSPQKRLPLRKIYDYISLNFPHFKPDVGGWKNSVRHNLSLNDCFVKQPRQPGEGKGHNWVIKPGCEEDFENCENDAEGFKKRRRRRHAKKTSKNFYNKNFATPAPAYMTRLPRNTMPSVLPSHCLSASWSPDYSAVYQTRMAHQAAAAAAGGWKYLEQLTDQYNQQPSQKLSQASLDAVGRNVASPSIGSAAVSPPSTAAAAAAAAAAVVAAEATHQQSIVGYPGQLASQNAFSTAYQGYSNSLFGNSNQDLSCASRLSATQNLFLGQFPSAAVAHCQIGSGASSLESPTVAAAFSAAAAAAHSQLGDYTWASSC